MVALLLSAAVAIIAASFCSFELCGRKFSDFSSTKLNFFPREERKKHQHNRTHLGND